MLSFVDLWAVGCWNRSSSSRPRRHPSTEINSSLSGSMCSVVLLCCVCAMGCFWCDLFCVGMKFFFIPIFYMVLRRPFIFYIIF